MKKYFLSIFVLLFLCTKITSAQQEAHIFIPILATDKLEYAQGEIIKGQFQIDNNSDFRQSDVYITTSLIAKVNEKNVELNTQKHQEGLYLEANSKIKLPIEHIVNADINGPAEFVIKAFLKDGSLVGQKRNPVVITNKNAKEIITLDEAYIKVEEDKFPLQAGPTVSKDGSVKIEFTTAKISKNIPVQAKIELYDRTQLTNTPVKTITPPEILFSSKKTYSFALPADLESKVYEGVLSFESSEAVIAPLHFRYIIEGPIGTILNANASQLSVNKGDTIQVLIEYAGTPPVVMLPTEQPINPGEYNFPEVKIPEDIDATKLSSEDTQALIQKLIAEQSQSIESEVETSVEQKATIKVSLVDEKGEVIGTGSSTISLNDSGTASIDVSVSEKAKKFSIISEMTLEDGTVLSTYKTDLPSEKELKDTYGTKNIPSWIVTLFIIILAIIILIGLVLIRKKLNTYAVVLILPLLATIGSFTYLYTSDAFTAEFASQANQAAHFKVNAIFSPGPADSIAYDPGESFILDINASYVACTNSGFVFTNGLYGPPQDWWNFDLDLNSLATIFDYQNTIFYSKATASNYRFVYRNNLMNSIGDYSSPTLNRFVEWWTSNTVLSGVQYFVEGMHVSSAFIQSYQPGSILSNPLPPLVSGGFTNRNNIVGKGGTLLFSTSAVGSNGSYVTSHEYTSDYSMNSGATTYTMPQEPGFHTFYFMLTNWASGNTASTRIVSQEVCVRGAGVCPGETSGMCPNLAGPLDLYYKNSSGVIMHKSENPPVVATDLIEDANGDCFPPPTGCPGQAPADTCVDGITHSAQCNLIANPPAWQMVSTGNSCNTDLDQLSCAVSNSNPTVDSTNVTYTATTNVSNPTYQWYTGSGSNRSSISGATGNTYSKIFNTLNEITTRTIEVTKSDNSKLYVSCPSVSIDCGTQPTGGETSCPGDGYSRTYVCTDNGWLLVETPCPSNTAADLIMFKFNPNIADSANTCPLIVQVTNVKSCTLSKRGGGTVPSLPVVGLNVDFNGPAQVGTYTLSCTDLDDTIIEYDGSRSCYSNSDFQEN